jgi:hypothetical protein
MNNIIRNLVRKYPQLEVALLSTLNKSLKDLSLIDGANISYIELYSIMFILKQDYGTLKTISIIGGKKYTVGKIDVLEHLLENTYKYFKSDSKYTKLDIISKQLDKYENIYGWKIDDKFLFPANNFGNYAIMVIIRLMKSANMVISIPDEIKRFKFIIENQIYTTDSNADSNFGYSSIIDIGNEFSKNIYSGDFLKLRFKNHMENIWKVTKFSAIFSDPPYIDISVTNRGPGSTAAYIYDKYIAAANKICNVTVMLTPSRWLQTDNTRNLHKLIELRKDIILSKKLRLVESFPPDKINDFSNGGISYFIHDNNYSGDCSINGTQVPLLKDDIILIDGKFSKLVTKIINNPNFSCINNRLLTSSWSGIITNNEYLSPVKNDKDDLKVYVSVKKNKDRFEWFPKTKLRNNLIHLNSWKVFTPETATTSGKGFSTTFHIGEPNEVCNQTFNMFVVDSKTEAESLISYLKTNFANKLVGIRKIKNHISKESLSYLPNVPLNKIWTDKDLYNHFELTQEEIELIN